MTKRARERERYRETNRGDYNTGEEGENVDNTKELDQDPRAGEVVTHPADTHTVYWRT